MCGKVLLGGILVGLQALVPKVRMRHSVLSGL